MTPDATTIRTALQARVRAAGLDDPATIPEPRLLPLAEVVELRAPNGPRRVLAAAAAVLVLGIGAVAALTEGGGPSTPTPATVPPAGPIEDRPALPAPLPALPTLPPAGSGAPVETPDQLQEQLEQLVDAQARYEADVVDQMTGELVRIDLGDLDAQLEVLLDWYRTHVEGGAGASSLSAATMDPVPVFTDGSYRLVYRSDLDCSVLPDGRPRPACTLADLGS